MFDFCHFSRSTGGRFGSIGSFSGLLNSPLDIRFRADALGSMLLLVGYSMSDPNIRLLLHRHIWDDSGHRQDRPKSLVFVAQRNPVQEAVLANWDITTIAPMDGVTASRDQGCRDRARR